MFFGVEYVVVDMFLIRCVIICGIYFIDLVLISSLEMVLMKEFWCMGYGVEWKFIGFMVYENVCRFWDLCI